MPFCDKHIQKGISTETGYPALVPQITWDQIISIITQEPDQTPLLGALTYLNPVIGRSTSGIQATLTGLQILLLQLITLVAQQL